MFNLEYLAANVGSDIELGGDVFKNEELVADEDGKITLSLPAVPIRTNGTTYAYIRLATDGGAKRTAILVQEDNSIQGLEPDAKYCVRYMYNDGASRKLTINSNFIPGTFYIIMTASLFSGDSCNVTNTGTEVGQLTIKVPRFQLNGSQELSMSASGISNTSLEGSALASGCNGCDDSGAYAEIIETIFNSLWYDNFVGLTAEDEDDDVEQGSAVNMQMVVYAVPASGSPVQIDNEIIAIKEANVADDLKTELVYAKEGDTAGLNIDASTGMITGTAPSTSTTFTFTATLKNKATGNTIPGFVATKTVEAVKG